MMDLELASMVAVNSGDIRDTIEGLVDEVLRLRQPRDRLWFLRLPRFVGRFDTEEGEPDQVYVSVVEFGLTPLTHCSEEDDPRYAMRPMASTLTGKPLYATQLWLRSERIQYLLDHPDELAEPTTIVDMGHYSVIGDGHHRVAARMIAEAS